MTAELCLRFEAGGPAQAERARAALAGARPVSVVLAPAPGQSLDAATLRPLIELFQAAGVATLVLDAVELAKSTAADGVHLSWRETLEADYAAARKALGPGAIVGVDALQSRHDAMTLGDAGADYVAFAGVVENLPEDVTRDEQLDLCAWWAELFELPVVALDVSSPEQAAALAGAGADFVSATIATGSTADDVRRRLAAIREAIASAPGGEHVAAKT